MRSLRILSALAFASIVASPALAGHAAARVKVSDAWFRALPAELPAGGYFQLHNDGAEDAVLTAVRSPACGMVMLHQSVESGGVSRMMHVDSVSVPAHGDVAFKPGGYHLMCMMPKPAMKPGAKVAVTLQFADGSKTVADFAVKSATGE